MVYGSSQLENMDRLEDCQGIMMLNSLVFRKVVKSVINKENLPLDVI